MKSAPPSRLVARIKMASGREEVMPGIDFFLGEVEQLRAMRESGDDELRIAAEETLEAAARAYYSNVDVGAARAALERAERARSQRVEAAKQPRPRARDPLRVRIIEAMKAPKRGGMEFKPFIAQWEDGEKRGLTIAHVRKTGKFKVRHDAEQLSGEYTIGGLMNLWTKAN